MRSWEMFGFHHFFDQMDGRLMGVAAIRGAVKALRLVLNHFGIGVSLTGVGTKFLIKSVMRGHGVRSQ